MVVIFRGEKGLIYSGVVVFGLLRTPFCRFLQRFTLEVNPIILCLENKTDKK